MVRDTCHETQPALLKSSVAAGRGLAEHAGGDASSGGRYVHIDRRAVGSQGFSHGDPRAVRAFEIRVQLVRRQTNTRPLLQPRPWIDVRDRATAGPVIPCEPRHGDVLAGSRVGAEIEHDIDRGLSRQRVVNEGPGRSSALNPIRRAARRRRVAPVGRRPIVDCEVLRGTGSPGLDEVVQTANEVVVRRPFRGGLRIHVRVRGEAGPCRVDPGVVGTRRTVVVQVSCGGHQQRRSIDIRERILEIHEGVGARRLTTGRAPASCPVLGIGILQRMLVQGAEQRPGFARRVDGKGEPLFERFHTQRLTNPAPGPCKRTPPRKQEGADRSPPKRVVAHEGVNQEEPHEVRLSAEPQGL